MKGIRCSLYRVLNAVYSYHVSSYVGNPDSRCYIREYQTQNGTVPNEEHEQPQ